MIKNALFIILLVSSVSCKKKQHLPPIDNAIDLDGNRIVDSSLISPSDFLLSAAVPNPTAEEKIKPVVIAVHGFSATNFEWQEFHSWIRTKNGAVFVSRVLLGGHGRDYQAFRDAAWTDWQAPVIEEYNRLRSLGFTNISFVASSTGCPLLLDMLDEKKVDLSAIRQVVFIDPIIVPSNKQLSLAPLVGGTVIHYSETEFDPGENGYWYKYRPQEALRELNKLTREMRRRLEKGISLQTQINVHVYKSEQDGSADPVSAVLLQKGLENCAVTMVASNLHVFTRLKGRAVITDEDRALQQKTFEEIYLSLF